MTDNNSHSNSNAPDLDWSQVRETLQMLRLSVAQIDYALSDSDDSISHLANSFTEIHRHMKCIKSSLADTAENKDAIEHSEQAGSLVQSAIVSFQFYDRLSQRIAHVSSSLESLASVVGDSSKLYNPNDWKQLQELIRSKYSTAEESAIFDSLLNGKDFDAALRELNEAEASQSDDVDFF